MRFVPIPSKKPRPDPAAAIAVEDSKVSIERVKENNEEVATVARSLRLMRERNHFAERLRPIMFNHRG